MQPASGLVWFALPALLLGGCWERSDVSNPSRVSVSISCGALGQELEMCRQGAQAWAAEAGTDVQVVSTPNSATERLALYQQLLAAEAPDVDVFQIDVVWPGILGTQLRDLRGQTGGAEAQHLPALVKNDTVDGRLVALPWFSDAGLLYFRKDLLDRYGQQVPETWEELTDGARRIQDAERAAGHTGMWGFVWQGRAYEGLTCDALEWLVSSGAGHIVDEQGRIDLHEPEAVTALSRAASWVGTISPPGVLNYGEEEARGVFQSGNAVFMRNWPYAWSLAQGAESPVRGLVGVAALPSGEPGGTHAATLGGWQLAVSRYSRHPEQATSLVLYLTSAAEQKRRAVVASFNPTIPALFEDPQVLAANPFLGRLRNTFLDAVARPAGPTRRRYNQVSYEFFNAVHAVLSGRLTAKEAVEDLRDRLRRLRRGGRW
jgi:trehalose/maltose transport system substrate-binding protein